MVVRGSVAREIEQTTIELRDGGVLREVFATLVADGGCAQKQRATAVCEHAWMREARRP